MSTDKPTVRDHFQAVCQEIGIPSTRCPWCLQPRYAQSRCETCGAETPLPWQLEKMRQLPDVFTEARRNP